MVVTRVLKVARSREKVARLATMLDRLSNNNFRRWGSNSQFITVCYLRLFQLLINTVRQQVIQ